MAVQLNFALRTTAQCKTVHLLGSWDNYSGQLPLSKDSAKAGAWKGAFRFQGKTLQAGQRYWYYYILDGYHVTHDPARDSVVEPTTKRQLNVLDMPRAKPTAESQTQVSRSSRQQVTQHRRHSSTNVAKGRSLSPSKIQSPQPCKPHATRNIATESFTRGAVDQLAAKLASVPIGDYNDTSDDSDSDAESDVPSLSSRSSNSSTPSSVSSTSSCCTCERYGITRAGARVKLDCGGSRCGYSDGSECSSESEEEVYVRSSARRHGIVASR